MELTGSSKDAPWRTFFLSNWACADDAQRSESEATIVMAVVKERSVLVIVLSIRFIVQFGCQVTKYAPR